MANKPVILCCGKCKAKNVRIYRSYGTFYRPETNRCNNCLPSKLDKRGWYVPCIADSDGTIWGYASVPQELCEKFYALPEKNPDKPGWNSEKSGWSDSKL